MILNEYTALLKFHKYDSDKGRDHLFLPPHETVYSMCQKKTKGIILRFLHIRERGL